MIDKMKPFMLDVAGATDGQALLRVNGVAAWANLSLPTPPQVIPTGGTTGQVLTKSSNADFALQWGGIAWSNVTGAPTTLAGYGITDNVLLKSGGTLTGTLTLAAGTTTVAPLMLQASVLLTSAVAHAVEWNGTNLFVTTSGAARKTIAYTDSNITGSAATLTTGRTIAMTGDVTWTSPSFNGSGNVTAAATLATVNGNVGSFGSGTAIPIVTVNGKGLVTSIGTAPITGTITVVIDGNGAVLTTGAKGDFQMPFSASLTGWTLLSDQIGSVVVEISKSNYATWPTVTAITASAKPTITSERKATSTTLTGWTTAITANDVLQIGINSAATIQRVTLMLHYTRT